MEETKEYGEFFGTGILYGFIDPSLPPGIPSRVGMLYSRDNEGNGELWLKIGVEDTNWGKVQVV